MITRRDLENQREHIQDDLICMLDGLDDEFITNVCQMICNRFDILLFIFEGEGNVG